MLKRPWREMQHNTAEATSTPPAPTMATTPVVLRTCRICHARFDPALNDEGACQYHLSVFTGREKNKALGIIPAQKETRGILFLWDCCGAENEDAPGCARGRHMSYDDD